MACFTIKCKDQIAKSGEETLQLSFHSNGNLKSKLVKLSAIWIDVRSQIFWQFLSSRQHGVRFKRTSTVALSRKKKESRVLRGLPILKGKNERKNDLLGVQLLIYVCLLVFIGILMIDRVVSRGVVRDFLPYQQNGCQRPEFRSGTSARGTSKYFSQDFFRLELATVFSFLLFHSTDSLLLFPFRSIDFSVKIFTRRWIIDVTRCMRKYTELGSILITDHRVTMNHSLGKYISCVLIYNLLYFHMFSIYLSFLLPFFDACCYRKCEKFLHCAVSFI